MPLVAQSLKIEFSHNNCALQEVPFVRHEFHGKLVYQVSVKGNMKRNLVYQASLKGKMKKN